MREFLLQNVIWWERQKLSMTQSLNAETTLWNPCLDDDSTPSKWWACRKTGLISRKRMWNVWCLSWSITRTNHRFDERRAEKVRIILAHGLTMNMSIMWLSVVSAFVSCLGILIGMIVIKEGISIAMRLHIGHMSFFWCGVCVNGGETLLPRISPAQDDDQQQ